MFSAASATVSAIRLARVSSRFALAIHQRMDFVTEGLKKAKFVAAASFASSAARRSGGIVRLSTASYAPHEPSAFAASILARPAGVP